MKTCRYCNIEVDDEEIFCPKCGEMLSGEGPAFEDGRRSGGFSSPPQPEPLSRSEVVLNKRYGKRIIQALRSIATAISFVTAGAILAVGVLTILGKNPLKLPDDRQMLVGILALPVALIVGFLLYFLFNIVITKYENISLIGRNTEAQLSLLENQSQLISALLDAMNENNRRVDVIGEMLDDVLRLEERQISAVEQLSAERERGGEAEPAPEDTARDESLALINENLCNGAANTQTMLRRLESAVNNGLGKLYKMWYAALNRGAEPPEDSSDTPAPEPAAKPASQPAAKPAAKPAPQPAAKPAPQPAAKPAPQPAPQPAAEQEAHEAGQPEKPRPHSVDPLDEMDKNGSGELLLGDDEYDLDAIITEAAADDSPSAFSSSDNNDNYSGAD